MKVIKVIPPPPPPKAVYVVELDEDEMERLFALSWFFEGDCNLVRPGDVEFFPGDSDDRFISIVPQAIQDRFFKRGFSKR